MERLTLCANNNSNAIQFELNSKVSLKVKRVLHTGKTYFNFYIENFVNLPENCTGFLGMYNLCLQNLSSMINRLLSQLKIYNTLLFSSNWIALLLLFAHNVSLSIVLSEQAWSDHSYCLSLYIIPESTLSKTVCPCTDANISDIYSLSVLYCIIVLFMKLNYCSLWH
jgi:hypothetical protein